MSSIHIMDPMTASNPYLDRSGAPSTRVRDEVYKDTLRPQWFGQNRTWSLTLTDTKEVCHLIDSAIEDPTSTITQTTTVLVKWDVVTYWHEIHHLCRSMVRAIDFFNAELRMFASYWLTTGRTSFCSRELTISCLLPYHISDVNKWKCT